MRQYMTIVSAAALVIASAGISGGAVGWTNPQIAEDPMPLRPSVDFAPVRETRLHTGMDVTDVTSLMGEPAKTINYVSADISMQTLEFSTGPIRSKITLANGRVSGVALDVFRLNRDDLPAFAQAAWPGFNSATVVRQLGDPSEMRHHAYFGINVDQLIFRRAGEPEISTFFVEDRLIAKGLGHDIPVDMFRVLLPSPSDTATEGSCERSIRIGATASSVKALYGAATLDVEYRFNGQPAEHAIYEMRPGGSFVSVTFVDDIVTEFADIGRLPEDPIFQGR